MGGNKFENALFDLIQNYKKALDLMKENEYIKNPVAWALYQTWRKYDKGEEIDG
ncbi:hypothetical protein [Bacillus infantis]|uniref:hypothetical protein n=1 Tax=Bacillus infantis TaxID=324767 RepID=UPI003CE7DD95